MTYDKKRDHVWVTAEQLSVVGEILSISGKEPERGLCHGVRTGFEVDQLAELTGAAVVGTELGLKEETELTADGNVLFRWDFHESREDWEGQFDFVYSNSLDHSWNPERAVETWTEQLQQGGLLFLHWSPGHNGSRTNALQLNGDPDPSDCLAATRAEYESLVQAAFLSSPTVFEFEECDRVLIMGEKK